MSMNRISTCMSSSKVSVKDFVSTSSADINRLSYRKAVRAKVCFWDVFVSQLCRRLETKAVKKNCAYIHSNKAIGTCSTKAKQTDIAHKSFRNNRLLC